MKKSRQGQVSELGIRAFDVTTLSKALLTIRASGLQLCSRASRFVCFDFVLKTNSAATSENACSRCVSYVIPVLNFAVGEQ